MGSPTCSSYLKERREGRRCREEQIQNHSPRNVPLRYTLINRQLPCKVSALDGKWAEKKQMWRTMKNHLTL